jgi:hypothetical protein
MQSPPDRPIEPEATPASLGSSAKDEMNLAEFPIALVTDRMPAGEKTIRFQDRIYDERKGQLVTRKLIITASDEYGLPTAKDDEVILGLIQLTRRANGFTGRTVRFSRSELIGLLGWPDTGPSYRRLALAFHRWLGVSLHYDNAWWDKAQNRWTTLGFHIIESFKLASEGGGPRGKSAEPPLSRFTWNEDVFRSFQAGYLKQLDLDFYLDLTLPTSKRIYRFLDKRFHHRDEWLFDLKEFALDHVGLSRKYEGNTQLARKLAPAIRELELRGFLAPLEAEKRYVKTSARKWLIRFVRSRAPDALAGGPSSDLAEPNPELVAELTRRGVSPGTARGLAANHAEELIREKLAAFDWLRSERDGRVLRSPAGFLVQSIREGYETPQGFTLQAEKAKATAASRKRARLLEEQRERREAEEQELERLSQERARACWNALTPDEQGALWTRAVAAANPLYLRMYREHEGTGTESEDRWREILLHPLLLDHLDALDAASP